jgi:hypothetical protein
MVISSDYCFVSYLPDGTPNNQLFVNGAFTFGRFLGETLVSLSLSGDFFPATTCPDLSGKTLKHQGFTKNFN